IGKVAVDWLAGMVSVGSAPMMLALLLESVTVAPPAGAGPDRGRVPVDGWPEPTTPGVRLRLVRGMGDTNPKHISKFPPRLPSPLGRRNPIWVEPSESVRVAPNASPSRYMVGSSLPQITLPLRFKCIIRLAGSLRFLRTLSPALMKSRVTRVSVTRIWLE